MGSNMTIGKRFIMTAGVLVILCTILSGVAIVGFNSVSHGVNMLATDAIPGTTYSLSIKADISRLSADYLNHMLEDDPADLQKVEQDITLTNTRLTTDMKAYQDASTGEEDARNFAKLQPELDAINQTWAKVLPLSRGGKDKQAYAIFKTDAIPHVAALRDQAEYIAEWNEKVGDSEVGDTTRTARNAWWMSLCTGLVSLIMGVLISWMMITALNKQVSRAVSELTEGAEQIASAATQVSSSSQSLAQGSSEQAASIEETSASSEEINSMARKNMDNSRSTAALVGQSQEMFAKTNRQLEEMIVSMDEINESSGKISKIIKVIDEIAFQTNILALNAAVEAARAGEAGMGFAVVADEVRSLAQRSAQAAKDTAILIEESISKSNGGKIKVDQVASAIRGITEDSSKIKTLVDEVSLGSEEQSRGLEQIARAITQMEQVTQTTAANAEESAAAAEELNAQSEALRDVVARLDALVGGETDQQGYRRGLARTAQPNRGSSVTKKVASFVSHLGTSNGSHSLNIAKSNGGGMRQGSVSLENSAFPMEAAFKEF
jgi:methyl-accepting chemotaxis protein